MSQLAAYCTGTDWVSTDCSSLSLSRHQVHSQAFDSGFSGMRVSRVSPCTEPPQPLKLKRHELLNQCLATSLLRPRLDAALASQVAGKLGDGASIKQE